ncbi:hypothetical protein ACFC09_07395 [Streptomyces sp. NPDC056161]|uniref:hypothetical protein n=1 Tax=Streptomyces sp. NPDC056161 TaxID=3345732 RepID=UPI0035D781FC
MKHFVLVAGYELPPKNLPFRAYCENRIRRLVAANKAGEDLVFQIFDVGSGEVVARTFTYPGGTRTESVAAVRSFLRVTRARYDGHAFKDGQDGVMSVTDVYAAVRTIGARAPGTLMELSFVSHGFYGGPVLVNSYDDGIAERPSTVPGGRPVLVQMGSMARDPDDKDPRAKDFHAANMEPAELAAFQAAYHPDGINWTWGCAFDETVHQILTKLEFHPEYRSAGLPDSKALAFRNLTQGQVYVLEKGLGTTFPDHREVDVTFGEMKRFFRKYLLSSYSHALAVASRRRTFGGLVGTYAEPDTGPRPLMHINSGFSRHFTFYKNYFGFAFDPEGRRYGLYDPAFA